MSSSKITSHDKVTIVEWYYRGMYSQRELADIYGVSRTTIRRVLDEYEAIWKDGTPDWYGEAISDEAAHLPEDTGPPETQWAYPLGLLAALVGLTGFVAWVINHAYS